MENLSSFYHNAVLQTTERLATGEVSGSLRPFIHSWTSLGLPLKRKLGTASLRYCYSASFTSIATATATAASSTVTATGTSSTSISTAAIAISTATASSTDTAATARSTATPTVPPRLGPKLGSIHSLTWANTDKEFLLSDEFYTRQAGSRPIHLREGPGT